MSAERGLWPADPAQSDDLKVFAARALRLDEAAVVRLRVRAAGLVGAWVATASDVLAARAVAGRMAPADLTCAAVPGDHRSLLRPPHVSAVADHLRAVVTPLDR